MKTQKIFLAMAGVASMVAFTACSSDEADGLVSNSDVIKITSVLKQTRSAEDPQNAALANGNTVGVFVTNSKGEQIVNGDNNQYNVSDAGKLELADSQKTMVYPAGNNSSVNIYAYAPYAAGWGMSSDNSFSVATDQTTSDSYLASDLLYASVANQAKTEDAVKLSFTHKLSQLVININNENAQILTYASVYVCGTKVATTFNPSTGALGEATGEAADIKAIDRLGAGTKAYAVVVPQTVSAGTELVKIVTADKTFTAKVASDVEFKAGSAYSFEVTVNSSTTTALTLSDATELTEWTAETVEGAETGEAYNEEVRSYADASAFTFEWFGSNNTNGAWDPDTNTYKWVGGSSNLMTIFAFENGELANYKTLKFTLSSKPTNAVRILLVVNKDKSYSVNDGYYSAGVKEVDLVALAKAKGFSLADITRISFGGQNCKENCYWVETKKTVDNKDVVYPAAWESVVIDPASIYLSNL
jgi:hypothetical protein